MRALLVVFLFLVPAEALAQRRVTVLDGVLAGSLVTAWMLDAGQSREAQARGWVEYNPVLGQHPSNAAMTAWAAGVAGAELLVASRLRHPWRELWLVGALGLETVGVVGNARAGLGLRF